MSNKEQTERVQDVNSKPFYKKASFPWAIIVAAVIALASFVAGWHMSQSHTTGVQAEAEKMVTSLTKKDQK